VNKYSKDEVQHKLNNMVLKVTKASNSYYNAVKTGAAAAKGTDEWIIQKMKAKVTGDHYFDWFKIMVEGNYKQKKTARNYAKNLLGL
tara:strand:+ start:192 stop:452 length:261 start_codon:yes stop_codon:yes gene_type:complete